MYQNKIIAHRLLQCQALFIVFILIFNVLVQRFSLSTYESKHFIPNLQVDSLSFVNSYSDDIIMRQKNTLSDVKIYQAKDVMNEKVGSEIFSKNFAVVDISEQREYVFEDKTLVNIYKISTGGWLNTDYDSKSYPNVWKISYRMDSGLEPLYGSCLLGLDVYKDGEWVSTSRALHGTDTPDIIGLPMSLGCIYHKNEDALKVCALLDIGDIVVTIK